MTDRMEKVRSRFTHKDNLRMWGQLYVSATGQTVGGWLVNTWSENGAPYWRPELHWLDKKESKLHHVHLNIEWGKMDLYTEDTEIEPERAEFIRTTTATWEQEWLEEESKNL